MAFHTWTPLYIIAALFSAGVGIFFLRSNRKSTSRICLLIILFILSAWAFMDFVNNFVEDTIISTLLVKSAFIILGFIPVLFFLVPYTLKNNTKKINHEILILFIIPIILASVVLFTYDFATTEYASYGYHINYNVPAVIIWSAIFITTTAAGL